MILAKIAEYVGQMDRNVVRTPTKTTIVVPNEALSKMHAYNRDEDYDDIEKLSAHLLESTIHAHDWPISDFLKPQKGETSNSGNKIKPKTTIMGSSPLKKDSLNSFSASSSPIKRSSSAPRIRSPQKEDYLSKSPRNKKSSSSSSSSAHYHHNNHTELDDKKTEKKKSHNNHNNHNINNNNNHSINDNIAAENNDNQLVQDHFVPAPESERVEGTEGNKEKQTRSIFLMFVLLFTLIDASSISSPRQIKKSISVEEFLNTGSSDGVVNYDSLIKNPIFQEKINEVSGL
jgi:hypothetical protein